MHAQFGGYLYQNIQNEFKDNLKYEFHDKKLARGLRLPAFAIRSIGFVSGAETGADHLAARITHDAWLFLLAVRVPHLRQTAKLFFILLDLVGRQLRLAQCDVPAEMVNG